ncbi:hypothetical protein [Rhizobium sullae]|uniref:hypothetical protein n=1 Tax=Rhizobium sullae TaxID=50338 RepID=UPI000B34C0E0|nr:hypothetical protein [Rhizobium sullae]
MLTNGLTERVKTPAYAHPGEAGVREELQRVLASTAFKATPRRKKLLQYLVEELLSGRARELKGYTIATLVFGRDENFDPQTDPVVRLEARRLRHDLDSYYVSAGRGNPLRISIPKGQYAPAIEAAETSTAVSSAVPTESDEGSREPGARNNSILPTSKVLRLEVLAAPIAVVLILAVVAYAVLLPKPSSSMRDVGANGTALAVLPFDADGDYPAKVLLANGMADEIMSGINRFGVFRLYMPSAGDKSLSGSDPIEIGNRLNLAYVVNGMVDADAAAGTLNVNARLIDVQSQRILWIGSYDRNYTVDSLRAVQREIAAAVATALGQPYGVLRTDESTRMAGPASDMSSYQCVLRAYAYRRSFKRVEHESALSCLEQAVQRDPKYAEAWAMLAWLYMDEGRFGWTADGKEESAYHRALATARHAIALERDNISGLKALASTQHYMGNYAESVRIQRQALAINPNDPDTLAQLGWRLAVRGNAAEGIPFLRRAIERSVNPPGWYYHLIAIDQYQNGQYEEMLATAQRATIDGSGISWSFVAIAEGALGEENAARKALAKMAEISPQLARDPAAGYRRHQAIDSIVDALVSGLRKAGWRELAGNKDPA